MPMPNNEWKVINDAWEFLKSNLKITKGLLDDLISEKVLDAEEQQRISLEPEYGEVEKLLLIIKHKPSECKAYVKLKKVLRADNKFIADELEKTEKKFPQDRSPQGHGKLDVDTSVHKLKDRIRQVLIEEFDTTEGQGCLLSEVIDIVSVTVEADGFHYSWNVDQLRNFVIDDVFVGVTFERRKKKKPASFRNLGIKKKETVTLTEQHAAASGEAGSSISFQGQTQSSRISSMSAADLVDFLKPKLIEIGIEETTMQKMVKEGIDGEAFMLLEKEDLMHDFPEMTLGKRIKFMHLKQTVLEETVEMSTECLQTVEPDHETSTAGEQEEDQMYPDKFHKFDSEVGSVDAYVKGRLLEVEGHTRGSLMIPRRHFICPTEEGRELCRKIAREAVIFASACMNERTNGTLHAGVCPPSTSDGKPGEILGLRIDRAECDEVVNNFIKESFYEDQFDIAEKAIRNVKFIPVVNQTETGGGTSLFVVEIEVVPSAKLVRNDAFFVKTQLLGNRRKKRKQDLYRMVAGKPEPQTEENVISFMERKQTLTELRTDQESNKLPAKYNVDLRRQILNLFTGGGDRIEDDIYPVLFTSPLDLLMDKVYLKENLSFIQHLDSRVIFDFDPSSSEKGLYKFFDEEENQCFTVLTTDDFQNPENTIKNEVSTAHKAWVFSNGYSRLQMDGFQPFEWKQERSEGFKEALRFYHQNIPNNRGIAVIFLFSKNYEVMLEVAEDVLLKFKDQWMVIAENEDIAELWKREMLRRNVAKKESLEQRCVVGMPWCDVNQTFMDVLQPKKVALCQVPLSNGVFRDMTEKERNIMCDLEILSSNECDHEEILDKDQIEDLRTKVEEKFFRGGTVEWWNFWFGEDHVKKRQLHSDLIKEVDNALSTQKADEVGLVTLLHQPGAGGTTSSRQVLWDLRQRYKCCILRRISDDTAEQIANLRRYGESSNPRPPLILVDNEDEEYVDELLAELEDMARLSARKNEDANNVFCVLLRCERTTSLPHSHEGRQIHLRHDLFPQELIWFRKKYDELKKKNEEGKGVNPKSLISFNLLKNNFNPEYVQRTVRMLMRGITDEEELRLLRYLSFLNTYDLDFRSIPVACFDPIMKTEAMQMTSMREKSWETKLGSSIRVLLNESSNRKMYGAMFNSICLINSVLSKEILASFLKSQDLSEIFFEILNSKLFVFGHSMKYHLLNIICTMVKKRAKKVEKSHGENSEKSYTEKFAPLILEIMTKEGEDIAAEVFIEVFKEKDDPMVAQQLARLYIHYRNWTEAAKYASKATSLFPTSSFLWDTHAQVYEQQLKAKAECCVTQNIVTDSFALAHKAIESYRKEQKYSETAEKKSDNYYGYFGEVRVTISLVDVLWKYMDTVSIEENDRHAFLVQHDFVPEVLWFLEPYDIDFIKDRGKMSSVVIEKLEDVLLQLKPDTKSESSRYFVSLNKLMEIKEQLFQYYGENTDDIPEKLGLEEQCQFRRRRVRTIGATSLQGVFQLRYKNKAATNLIRVYKLMMQNVNTSMCISFDLCTVLNTIVVMSLNDDDFVKTIPFPDILHMSQRLVDVKKKDLLESYLYILLFNVPTPTRLNRGYELCQSSTIRDTIKLWKEAFYCKYPRQREEQKRFRKKDTTLFFLGHGDGVDEIVHHKQLDTRDEGLRVSDDFWLTPIARQKFLRYEGTLLMNGMEVQAVFESKKGNKYDICIPTSMPVKKTMWQKKVFFVLGFSWSGPKAYHVTLDDPSKPDPKEPALQNPPMTRSDGLSSTGSPRGATHGRGGSSPRQYGRQSSNDVPRKSSPKGRKNYRE